MSHPAKILEQYWGFTQFKPLQEDIINAVIDGEDTFALLPTGGGKSICFQIPALIQEGICIVVSPLIALMKNQVSDLHKKGIKAIALTSEYSFAEVDTMLDNCIYGDYKFLYISPERLQQEIVRDRIQQMKVNLIAVDEAHCISQWGNDFRPAYKNIIELRSILPTTNCIALTASATTKVVGDIIKELDFISPKIFKTSFLRNNLAYHTTYEEDKFYRIEKILNKYRGSSIIYVRNRKSTYQIAQLLEDRNIKSTYYHGGLSNNEKSKHFDLWFNNSKQVMVATNAFGMGIDKADVETVIHLHFPESLESYFQEAGRAGRNQKKAYAILLKNKGDEGLVKSQFLSVLPDIKTIKLIYRKLCNYFQISYGEGANETFDFDFGDFCKVYDFNYLKTYNGLLVLDRTSIISLNRQFRNNVEVQFIIPNQALLNYLNKNTHLSIIIKTILRTYGGIFDQATKIRVTLIADKSGATQSKVTETLKQLELDGLITLKLNNTDAQITFISPREDDKTINRISKIIQQQNDVKKKHINAVLSYINNDVICKSVQLLRYFGEKDTVDCGICSVCVNTSNRSNKTTTTHYEMITAALKSKPLSSREIVARTNLEEDIILEALEHLLENDKIKITNSNTYKLI